VTHAERSSGPQAARGDGGPRRTPPRLRVTPGVYHVESLDVVVVYDNNPYEADTYRNRQWSRAVVRLAEAGIKMLAEDIYPPLLAEDAGYTVATVFDCSQDRMDFVAQVFEEEVERTLAEMESDRREDRPAPRIITIIKERGEALAKVESDRLRRQRQGK
jgi:hypothetical protein